MSGYRKPNPLNPWDCWDDGDLLRCLLAEVPGVRGVETWRDPDPSVPLSEARVVVGLNIAPGTDPQAAGAHALRLVALGCAPGVAAQVRTSETYYGGPPDPLPDAPRAPLHVRSPRLSHAIASGIGVLLAGVMNEFGWLGW